jgi:hypothetical protein
MLISEGAICDEPGCGHSKIQAVYVPDSIEPYGYYCLKHTYRHGFCHNCGNLCAESENSSRSQDFDAPLPTPIPGCCYDCHLLEAGTGFESEERWEQF